MIKLKHIKLFVPIITVMLLTACGGGGGGSSTNTVPTDDDNLVNTEPVIETPVVTVPTYDTGIKKTGQTKSYDASGIEDEDGVIKDDGHYQTGVDSSYSRANEIVTDNITGLMWQDNAEVTTTKKEWDLATSYCQSLSLSSYTDWRLPTIKELQTIISLSKSFPSIDNTFKKIASTTNIYWSSSEATKLTNEAWSVRFNYGYTMHLNKDERHYVRCVRDK